MMGPSAAMLVAVIALCSRPSTASAAYDGHRWLSAKEEERTGFVAGLADCDVFDMGHARLKHASWNVLAPRVIEYYRSHASEVDKPIWPIIVKLASEEAGRASDGGENYPDKHGFFDGIYWLQSTPAHRSGFIEGYVECARIGKASLGKFSRDARFYVARMTEWYGIQPDDTMDRARGKEKIANVLLRFGDEP